MNKYPGKLRLLYEAAPMSFLVEQAGGLALTGKNRIMEIRPKVNNRDMARLFSFFYFCRGRMLASPHHTPPF